MQIGVLYKNSNKKERKKKHRLNLANYPITNSFNFNCLSTGLLDAQLISIFFVLEELDKPL